MPRSSLLDKFTAPPQLVSYQGWEIPASFGSVEDEYWALKKSAGLADLSHRGRILVRGEDAARFLHGMLTNDVKGLRAGQGNYAFMLNVQGHVLADLRILRLDAESFLLDCEPQSYEIVWQQLDRHIIADIVEMEDRRSALACLALEGPSAREILGRAVGTDIPELNAFEHVYREDLQARLFHASWCGEEGYCILAAPDRAAELLDSILSLKARDRSIAAVTPVGFEALEICRIEAGIPRYGIDITDKNLAQETGQMQAISFNKGCYIGQEVVERIRSRGHVNRKLVQLLLEGRQQIAPETPILFDGQPAGATASSAYSFALGKTVALGYLRREYAEPGNRVMVGALTARVAEVPTAAAAAM